MRTYYLRGMNGEGLSTWSIWHDSLLVHNPVNQGLKSWDWHYQTYCIGVLEKLTLYRYNKQYGCRYFRTYVASDILKSETIIIICTGIDQYLKPS